MKKTAELCQTRDNRLGVPGLSYAFCPSQSLDLDQFIIEIAKCNLSCIGVFCPYFLSQDQFLFRVKSHSASQNYQYSHKLNVMSVVPGITFSKEFQIVINTITTQRKWRRKMNQFNANSAQTWMVGILRLFSCWSVFYSSSFLRRSRSLIETMYEGCDLQPGLKRVLQSIEDTWDCCEGLWKFFLWGSRSLIETMKRIIMMCQAAGEEQLLKKVRDCLSISNENLQTQFTNASL